MDSKSPPVELRAGRVGRPGRACAAPATTRRQGGRAAARTASRPGDVDARADAIGRAAPFSAWPRDVLLRLAAASTLSGHRHGTLLLLGGQRCDAITISVEGSVIAAVSSPGGRRLIYKFDDSAYAYGLSPLVDGLPPPHDVVADGPVTIVRMPIAAVRAELARGPALWESVALEVNRRGHGLSRQVQQFVFDAPLVRAAALLLGMLATSGQAAENGPTDLRLRLSQERLAELLGTSRQWATALVRELTSAGIVEWRYGGATVLDVPALRRLASLGIDALGQHSEHVGAQWRVDPPPRSAAAVSGARPVALEGAKRRAK